MRTRLMYSSGSIVILLLACAAIASAGSERTNIRGVGMGRTFVAGSRGLDAVGINPANLAWPDSGKVTLSLMPFSLHVGTDMMTYGTYKKYFTGVDSDSGRVGYYLSDADKKVILDGFPDGVGNMGGDVQVRPIGFSADFGTFGRFAFTITEQVAFDADIPRDYAQFILYGNPPGSTYDFTSTRGRAQWSREWALSFGRAVPPPTFLKSLNAGVALKFVQGFGYYEMTQTSTSVTTGMDGIVRGTVGMYARGAAIDMINDPDNNSFSPFPPEAGSGWGFDLGVSGKVTEYLTVGLAVTDIGSISWTRHVEESRVDSSFVIDDPSSESQRQAIEDALKAKRTSGESFSTSLPTRLRLGVAVELTAIPAVKEFLFGEMDVAADYNQGLADVPGSTTRGRFSLGMEYRIVKFFPIRLGVGFGGEDRSNFALGFGFHFGGFELDFASENLNWLFSQDAISYGSFAMGMKVRI